MHKSYLIKLLNSIIGKSELINYVSPYGGMINTIEEQKFDEYDLLTQRRYTLGQICVNIFDNKYSYKEIMLMLSKLSDTFFYNDNYELVVTKERTNKLKYIKKLLERR